jgi:hypothetical protein
VLMTLVVITIHYSLQCFIKDYKIKKKNEENANALESPCSIKVDGHEWTHRSI